MSFNDQPSLNVLRFKGYTPLHSAIKERHIELAVLLQRYGANSDIPDKYHRHALNYCISDMPKEVKFVKPPNRFYFLS